MEILLFILARVFHCYVLPHLGCWRMNKPPLYIHIHNDYRYVSFLPVKHACEWEYLFFTFVAEKGGKEEQKGGKKEQKGDKRIGRQKKRKEEGSKVQVMLLSLLGHFI